MERTAQLEAYLKALFAMKILSKKSKVFQQFFELRKGSTEYRRAATVDKLADDDNNSEVENETAQIGMVYTDRKHVMVEYSSDQDDDQIDESEARAVDMKTHIQLHKNDFNMTDSETKSVETTVEQVRESTGEHKSSSIVAYLREIEFTPLVVLLAMILYGVYTHSVN